jgi:hypothetical protein
MLCGDNGLPSNCEVLRGLDTIIEDEQSRVRVKVNSRFRKKENLLSGGPPAGGGGGGGVGGGSDGVY